MRLTEEGSIEVINKIKRRYEFKEDFDLREKLNYLPTLITLYPEFLRHSDAKKHLENVVLSMKNAIDTLNQTPAQVKILIQQTIEDLTASGYDIRRKYLDWNVSKTESFLEILYNACLFTKQNISLDTGGVAKGSVPQSIIFYLATVYHAGTEKHPSAYWAKKRGRYSGDFYEFVLCLEPLLNVLGSILEFVLMEGNTVLEEGKLYLREEEGKIAYSVIEPNKSLMVNVILEEVKAPSPLTLSELNKLQIIISDKVVKNGHACGINLGKNSNIGSICAKAQRYYKKLIANRS